MVKFKIHNSILADKEKIRGQILSILRLQDKAERERKSQEIKRRLFSDKDFRAAKTIMFYVSLGYEVDTMGMIEEALVLGKKILVPVTETVKKTLIPSEIKDPGLELSKGAFGIYEPKPKYIKAVSVEDIDMIIVPGIVFDRMGSRIGHGRGYFDRFLKDLPKKIPTIGLAFSFQLVDKIKTLPWDVPVTKVITA